MEECIVGLNYKFSPDIHEVINLKGHIQTYITPRVVPSDLYKLPVDFILGDYI